MKDDGLALGCRCGELRGALHRPPGERATRLVCYCEDCRAFARWLDVGDRFGAAASDADGGSDIYQVSPARLRFTHGRERLACLRLSAGGLLRWYASCCRTPVCNTPDARQLPFAGVSTRFVHVPSGATLDTSLGPVRFGVQAGRDHRVEAAWPVHAGLPFALLATSIRNVGGWRLRGDHRRSPLVDGERGEPVARPRTLSEGEREALRPGADA